MTISPLTVVKGDYFTARAPAGIIRCLEAHDLGPILVQDLAMRDLLPGTHLLDSGYVDADFLVTAQQQYQSDVVGPPFGSYS